MILPQAHALLGPHRRARRLGDTEASRGGHAACSGLPRASGTFTGGLRGRRGSARVWFQSFPDSGVYLEKIV